MTDIAMWSLVDQPPVANNIADAQPDNMNAGTIKRHDNGPQYDSLAMLALHEDARCHGVVYSQDHAMRMPMR